MTDPTSMQRFAKPFLTFVVLCLVLWGSGTSARADDVVFDFEGVAENGGLSILSLTQSGLTLTITLPGSTFGVFDSQPSAAGFGSRSLVTPNSQSGAFVVNFSSPLSSFSLVMGDGGQDEDRLILEAYSELDATGTLLATTELILPGGSASFDFRVLSVAFPGIRSVRFIGGSAASPNSVFYDNFVATVHAVPEPATLLLLGLGLGGVGGAIRKRRSR